MTDSIANLSTTEIQNEKDAIYIVLSTPASFTGKAIHVLTHDTYTHASIAFDSSIREMYSFGRRFRHCPFPGRIKKESMDSELFASLSSLAGVIIRVPVTHKQYEKVYNRTIEMYNNKHIYKYNYLGAAGNMFKIGFPTKNRFTCSEFVAYILEYCGVTFFNRPLNLVRPQTLAEINGEVVFSGDLKKYVHPDAAKA